MNNKTCGVVLVSIGRDYCIEKSLNYLSKVLLPDGLSLGTLCIVNATSAPIAWKDKFTFLCKSKGLYKKFKNIKIIPGFNKCYNTELDWNKWEANVRDQFMSKHLSTASNLSVGIDKITDDDFIHIIDDDIIPPIRAIKYMYKTLKSDSVIGMTGGLYFCKNWGRPEINLWRSDKLFARETCCSNKSGTPLTIDYISRINQQRVSYIGNGCVLGRTDIIKNTLPLTAEKINNTWGKGPDFVLCDRIREQNKLVYITPFICEHLYDIVNVAGIGKEWFNKLFLSNKTQKILITNNINYDFNKLKNRFDIVYTYNKNIQDNKKFIHHINNININTWTEKLIKQIPKDKPLEESKNRVRRVIHDNIVYSIMNEYSDYKIYSELDHTNNFYQINKCDKTDNYMVIDSTYIKDYLINT